MTTIKLTCKAEDQAVSLAYFNNPANERKVLPEVLAERRRANALIDLGSRHRVADDKVLDWIGSGISVEDAAATIR